MTYQLTCHCGAVEANVALGPLGLKDAGRCDCSFCRRRGAISVTAPRGGVTITKGAENLSLYTWGTHTAQHYFCKICGIYIYHQRRSDPNEWGVNALALNGVMPADLGDVTWADGVNHPSDQTQD